MIYMGKCAFKIIIIAVQKNMRFRSVIFPP